MKLHLNLTLRRAVLAAMALIAVHTGQAALTTTYNNTDAYISGNGTLTANGWAAIWNKNKAATLTIGTYQGPAVVTLSGNTQNNGKIIFIGGKGHNATTNTANNGELIVSKHTKLNATQLNVGNSMIGGVGTLTVNGGQVNPGNSLYVGVNAGSGIVNVTDNGSITVASGSTGAVFAMSHRSIAGLTDTVTLTNSSITVGTEGGVLDFTTVGHSLGTSILTLNKSTANFADQTLVGEKSGSNGLIHVHNGSSLNLGKTTVLGHEAGAKGAICIDAGTVTAQNLAIGSKGTGTLDIISGSLTSTNITAGAGAGAKGAITNAGSIKTQLLTIGEAGSANVTNSGSIAATDIVIGNAATGNGALDSTGTVTTGKLFIGNKGTGTAKVNGGSLSAADTYIVGKDSLLVTTNGKTTLTSATVVAGKLTTAEGGSTTVNGATLLTEGASLTNESTTTLGEVTVTENSSITNAAGTLTTGNIANAGSIDNSAAWKAASITNSGDITISGAGRITADSLSSTEGTTTILVDSSSVSTAAGEAIISLDSETTAPVNVQINVAEAASLVGKNVDFLKEGSSLASIDNANFSIIGDNDAEFVWADNYIQLSETEHKNTVTNTDGSDTITTTIITEKLGYTTSAGSDADSTTGLLFTRHELAEKSEIEIDWKGIQSVEIEVKTETVQSSREDVSNSVVQKIEIVTPENATEEEVAEIEAINVANQAAAEIIEKAGSVQKAEITAGVDDAGQDIKTKVVVGKDVTTSSDSTGSVQVQSVVVNQHTTFADPNVEDKSTTIGISGLALVFEGTSTHAGLTTTDGNKVSELGFSKDTPVGTTKIDNEETILKKVDIVQVKENANVTIKDVDMHATHSLTIGNADSATKTVLVLDNVDFHVGGETDPNILHVVEVKKYGENGEEIGTEKKIVETEAHLTAKSSIINAEVQLVGATILKFEEMDFGKQIEDDLKNAGLSDEEVEAKVKELHGQTTITNSEIVLTSGAQLGESNYKDSEDKEHKYQEITLENTTVKGSGKVKNTKMKGGKLTVGSSPGQLTVTDFKAEGKTQLEFFIIADTGRWNATGMNDNTNYATGSISQLVIDKNVELSDLNSQVVITFQKWNGTTYENVAADSQEVLTLGSYLQDGAQIKFIDGNLDELIISGETPVLSESALPTLNAEDGLFWDTSALFTEGIVTVIGEVLEEPTRIANSLVSAGETVLNFGRLAGAQAELREAGTTRTWGSAISMFDSIDSGNTTNGYDYNAWGAAVGVDHAFTKNTVLGVAFGCSWGENEAEEGTSYYDAGSIDQDAKMVGIYGTHKFQTKGLMNDVKLSAFAAYGWFENDSTRTALKNGNKATAEWDSDAWVLSASLSRDITTDDGVVFTPYVGVEYTKAGMDDFTETGKNSTADYSADEDYSNLSVKVGMTVSASFGSFTPYAGIAYINDVDRSAAEVTATGRRNSITGESALPGRDALQLKVGANWQLTETLDVNAGYTAEIRNKATEHNANVGIGLTF